MRQTNITLKQAEAIILKAYPNEQLYSVVDWDNYYVFNTIRKGMPKDQSLSRLLPLKAILKDSGQIMTFNPLHIGSRDYAKTANKNIKYY